MPARCAASMARASVTSSSAEGRPGWGVPARRSARLPPSSSSSDTNGKPSTSPISKICTMLGWRSRATASASIENRAKWSGARLAAAADHLQGDQAVQPQLPGLVDDPHAPLAESFHDLVTGDLRPFGPRSFVFTAGSTMGGTVLSECSRAIHRVLRHEARGPCFRLRDRCHRVASSNRASADHVDRRVDLRAGRSPSRRLRARGLESPAASSKCRFPAVTASQFLQTFLAPRTVSRRGPRSLEAPNLRAVRSAVQGADPRSGKRSWKSFLDRCG